jgi:O-antigen/teichoic acid export membrane protein
VTGVVYSTVISGIVLAGSLSVYVFAKVGVHFSRRLAAELLGFVAPLILAGFGATYVAFADRYFLRVFGGLHDVGLYALAARLGSVLGTAFEAFNSSWVADRFEIVKQDNAREVYGQFFRFLGAILLLAGAGLAIFAGDFFHIITDPEFYPAAGVVPILVAGIIIRMFVMFCNFGAVYTGRTRIIAESSWARAVVATTGFLLLIPPVGVYGAALALLVANAVEFAWLYRKSTALYDMDLEWRPVLLMAAAATAATMATQPLPAGRADFLAVRVIVYALLVVVVARLPFWRPDERALIREALLSAVRRRRAGR